IKVYPVAKGSTNCIDSIITTADSRRIPLEVKVKYSAGGDEYDPDDAEAYLSEIMAKATSAEETRQEVVQKVTKKARKEGQRIERVDGNQRRFS
ncbi:MAG: hypothetical protein K2F99_07085, partial [Muribaculaceae bacterium]|nr:hypothetical protein [Muribaculaceae bacterium]